MSDDRIPVESESITLLAYTEGMPPAPWNDGEGGEVWQWMHAHGSGIIMQQEDPGPAYGLIPGPDGTQRVDIGQTITIHPDRTHTVTGKPS